MGILRIVNGHYNFYTRKKNNYYTDIKWCS